MPLKKVGNGKILQKEYNAEYLFIRTFTATHIADFLFGLKNNHDDLNVPLRFDEACE